MTDHPRTLGRKGFVAVGRGDGGPALAGVATTTAWRVTILRAISGSLGLMFGSFIDVHRSARFPGHQRQARRTDERSR